MTISDTLLVLATFCGPIAAVQAQKWIERTREQRGRRLWIFQTLMATRAIRAGSNEHVQALNLIDVFFNGKSSRDRAVRDAWLVQRSGKRLLYCRHSASKMHLATAGFSECIFG